MIALHPSLIFISPLLHCQFSRPTPTTSPTPANDLIVGYQHWHQQRQRLLLCSIESSATPTTLLSSLGFFATSAILVFGIRSSAMLIPLFSSSPFLLSSFHLFLPLLHFLRLCLSSLYCRPTLRRSHQHCRPPFSVTTILLLSSPPPLHPSPFLFVCLPLSLSSSFMSSNKDFGLTER